MSAVLLYLTAADKAEAETLARALLEAHLVACVNVLPGVVSFYHWQEKLEKSEECALIAKTTTEKLQQAVDKVKALHSYACPCVVALPIQGGNPAFLEWIQEETAS